MIKNVISFEDFEEKVMQKLLEEKSAIFSILRQQYEGAQIESRYFSGKGFFTKFKISKAVPVPSNLKSFSFGNIVGQINGINVGFVLFITDGKLDCLEGYTYGDPWPDKITSYELRYADFNQ